MKNGHRMCLIKEPVVLASRRQRCKQLLGETPGKGRNEHRDDPEPRMYHPPEVGKGLTEPVVHDSGKRT